MIIEPITYRNEQHTAIDAFFNRGGQEKTLPKEAKDFILENIGLYAFIRKLRAKHLDIGKKMLEMCDQIKIHPPCSLNQQVMIEELIEKANKSDSVKAQEAREALESLERKSGNPVDFRNFKLCWMHFLEEVLCEIIKEKEGSS